MYDLNEKNLVNYIWHPTLRGCYLVIGTGQDKSWHCTPANHWHFFSHL